MNIKTAVTAGRVTALLALASGPVVEGAWRPEAEPVVLSWVAPSYPDIARVARVTGVVRVRLPLGNDGRPTDAVCLQSVPLFDAVAVKAARQWEFESSDESERVAVIDFVFQLIPGSAPPSDLKSRFLSPSVFAVRAKVVEVQVQTRVIS